MDHKEQITAFSDELDKLVDRFRVEWELTYADCVGVLFMKAHLLCDEAKEESEE